MSVLNERVGVTIHLGELFDCEVSAFMATSAMWDVQKLEPIERMAVRTAILSRQREFAAGRAAARRALLGLGLPECPIPMAPDRAPLWPPGVVGSISHCPSLCYAAVAYKRKAYSMGLDIEEAIPLPIDLYDLVFSPNERRQSPILAKLVFCAKESFYKCYYPLTKTFLDFHDVRIEFEDALVLRNRGSFQITIHDKRKPLWDLQAAFVGRWALIDNHIFAGTTYSAQQLSRYRPKEHHAIIEPNDRENFPLIG